jgi:cell division protein FtsL
MVVFFLLLSIAALVLGSMLFGKREVLKGRTQKIENTVIKIGALIEKEDAKIAEQDKPTYASRDVSPCTSTLVTEPELSTFWADKFKPERELLDQPKLDLNRSRTELMTYFKVDPVTQKVMRDAQGFPVTTGDGTMQAVLDDLVAKTAAQLNRLDDTRRQLKVVREELIDAITDLNTRKQELRKALNTIVQKDQDIADLNGKIQSLNGQIAQLEREKRELQDSMAERNKEVARLNQEIDVHKAQVAQQKKDIDNLRATVVDLKGQIAGDTGKREDYLAARVGPGDKGSVISLDKEWNFVVLSLTEAFLKEMLGENMLGQMPSIHLMVRRPGEKGAFVTKVRLIQVDKEKRLGVGNVLTEWRQSPIQTGDIVYY